VPRVAKHQPKAAKKSSHKKAVPNAKLRELREQAKRVREQVAQDVEQIAVEARRAVDDAIREGKLTKITVLFRPDEQIVLDALDQYGSQHGLQSRTQVVRAALSKLLNIDLGRVQPED
jgi:vacuolar-type H+-ATPase subunit E/Vma4